METFFLLIFLGIVCFVFFVYKCFTSDWHKAAIFFDQHPEEMFDDDDEGAMFERLMDSGV